MNNLLRLNDDTRGATMVEYVVILALIFLVAVTAWKNLGTKINTKVEAVNTGLN